MRPRPSFYGTCAIALGTWEAAAYGTVRVPTVTSVVRRSCRCSRMARAGVVLWVAGLAWHFLTEAA